MMDKLLEVLTDFKEYVDNLDRDLREELKSHESALPDTVKKVEHKDEVCKVRFQLDKYIDDLALIQGQLHYLYDSIWKYEEYVASLTEHC